MRFTLVSSLIKYLALFSLLFLSLVSYTYASCGDIIYQGYLDNDYLEEIREPIADCDNPFNVDDPEPFSYEVNINGQMVTANSVVTISPVEPVTFTVTVSGITSSGYEDYQLFKKEGEDYRQILLDFNQNVSISSLEEGEYVTILSHTALSVSQTEPQWKQWLKGIFLPLTAEAFYSDYDDVVAVPFTVEYKQPVPTGASSVLFLPGIQASRLYTEGSLGTENQLWEPNRNADVRKLSMTEDGGSVEDIYTKDVLDSVTGLGDVYAGFLSFLESQKTAELPIKEFTAFAYDWRFSVEDVVSNGTKYEKETKNLISELEYLAGSSYTNKVTIIAHSNGGLLAKALIRELENTGREDLVDRLILLASPQIGTPKAIGTILHGYDQQDKLGGIVISAKNARAAINNMPGAYGLLPSEEYFSGLDEPIVTFSSSVITEEYIQAYGTEITSYYDYVKFISGKDGFDRDINNPVSVPARGNGIVLGNSLSMHDDRLDTWVAPSGIKVFEIVGTGLPTMKSIEYREVFEDKCTVVSGIVLCVTESEIKPYAHLTKYGDGTVVQRSAEAYKGDKDKYFVNLKAYNDISKIQGNQLSYHYNITETSQIQDLLAGILVSTTTEENQFISTSHTEFNDEYEVEVIDSPVRLLATDEQGNQTGVVLVDGNRVIKQEIPGSQYFEFGGAKYFVVPKGINRTTRLFGEDYGGYTLTTAILDASDKQTVKTVLENASTTPELIAEYTNTDGVYGTIVTDSNGDGVMDYETTLAGDVVENEEDITYESLVEKIRALDLPRAREKVLLLSINKAHKFSEKVTKRKNYSRLEDKLLHLSSKIIKSYARRGFISETDADEVLQMTEFLKDK